MDEKKVYGLLEVADKPGKDGSMNIGNGVTNDVKLMVKVCVTYSTIVLISPADGCCRPIA